MEKTLENRHVELKSPRIKEVIYWLELMTVPINIGPDVVDELRDTFGPLWQPGWIAGKVCYTNTIL